MNCNVGKTDRAIRVIVAGIAATLGYFINPWFFIITFIGILTSITGFCGLYPLLKINTCKRKR